MKKAIAILLLTAAALTCIACYAMPKEVIAVPTDAERVVEMVLLSNPDAPAEQPPTAPEVAYAEEQYSFSAAAAGGKLNIAVDARVRYPASLQLPIARVAAVGFTQEQASAYFEYLFAGEQPIVVENYGAAKVTKQSLRDLIALYEQQIDDGTIMVQSLMTADEAREYIQELEAQIPGAPETVSPDVISDGTMRQSVWMYDDEAEPMLELNVETDEKWMHIYTPVNADEHAEGHLLYYHERTLHDLYGATETALAPNTSIDGMRTTWDEAVALCKEFFALGGVNDMTVGKAFQLEKDGKCAYRFHFVRTVAGASLAMHQEITRYKGEKTPWRYESVHITVDDNGLVDVGWGSPTKTTGIVNPAADAMPFAEVKAIFETMVVEFYKAESVRYDGFQWNYAVSVDEIELSLLRVRDVSTEERVGLYVPAWVFYGERMIDGDPTGNWSPRIVFAINAIDGSMIDMEKGY